MSAEPKQDLARDVVLQEKLKILKGAEQNVRALLDVELPEWKRRQQVACIGCPVDTCLDHLQTRFTTEAKVLLEIRKELQTMQDQNRKYGNASASSLLGDIATSAQSLLKELLTNALVVKKQPVLPSFPQRPLVLKTNVRFTTTVRFLSNLPEFQDLLKVTPVFDKDVEEAKTVKGFRHFDFCKVESKVLHDDSSSEGLVAEFPHKLCEVKGRTKGSNKNHVSVTEELHIIKFVTTFQHAGLKFDIEVSSLPVVVISSTSQVPSAWASVMWFNMLSTGEPRNLSLFVDPPPLTWQQVSQMLSWQFLLAGQRELDSDQLSVLREKLVDSPDDWVQWNNFSQNENAWIWIDGVLSLIKEFLVDLWHKGYIMGFVSRQQAQTLLQEKPSGTFLLRFSETNKKGAITFSWVEHTISETHVHAVQPYTKKDLECMSLPDIISLYRLGTEFNNPLSFLYPDIPKDTAFEQFYKKSALLKSKSSNDGYLNRIPMYISAPPTPPESPPTDVHMFAEPDTNMEDEMMVGPSFNILEFLCEDMEPTQINALDLPGL